ncbi:GYDIA family GHMP kinase [Chryseobacterium sp. T1]
MGRIFSPGKLLLTSEYVVLDGAIALAVPTKWGQEFFFDEDDNQQSLIFWKAKHQDQHWLDITIDYKNWIVVDTNLPDAAAFILKTLQNIQELGSAIFSDSKSYYLTTNLQFPADYGLGSSSTLMTNLAEWSGVDAFMLNELSLGGSGYDIAVAKAQSAILFWRENNDVNYEKVDFSPDFRRDLIFIHLGKKQDSREGIRLYRSKEKLLYLVRRFSEITQSVLQVKTLDEFSALMQDHEILLSDFLGLPTAKEKYFQDCPTFIKSLGAWGGDFVMSCRFENYEKYFIEKGYKNVFSWENMIDSSEKT